MSAARKATLDFDNWITSLPGPQQSAFQRQLEIAPDREQERRKLQNILWIGERAQVPFGEVARNYDAALAGYATRAGWGDVYKDDLSFNARVTSEAAAERDEETLLQGVQGDTEEARMMRRQSLDSAAYQAGILNSENRDSGDVVQAFAQWQKAAMKSPGYRVGKDGDYFSRFSTIYAEGAKDVGEARPVAEKVFPILAGLENGTTDIRDALPLFGELKRDFPRQFELVTRELRRMAKGDDQGGVGVDIARAVERGAERLAESGRGFLESLDAEGAATDAEFQRRTQIQSFQKMLLGRLRDVAENEVSPILSESWWGEALKGAASSVPALGAIAVPVAGPVAMFAAYTNDAEAALVERGVDPMKARNLAPVIGAAQSALDRVQLGLLKKFPGLESVLAKASTSGLIRFTGRLAGVTAAETAIEVTQDVVTPAIVQSVAAAVDEGMPGVRFSDVLEETWAATPETFLSMLPLALVGAGAASFRDVKEFRQLAADSTALQSLGFSPEQIAAIQLPDTDKESAAVLRALWSERKPVKQSPQPETGPEPTAAASTLNGLAPPAAATEMPAEVAGTAENLSPAPAEGPSAAVPIDVGRAGESPIPDSADTVAGTAEPMEAVVTEAALNQEAGIRELRRDDTGWYIVTEKGERINAGTVQAAQAMRQVMAQRMTQEEAAAAVAEVEALAAQNLSRGEGTNVTFSGESRRAKMDAEGNVVATRTRAGKSEVLQMSPATMENLRAEMRALGMSEAIMRGSNYFVRDDAGRLIRNIELNADAGLETIIHERFESLIRSGEVSSLLMFQGANQLTVLPQFDPAKVKNPGMKKVAESLRRIALDDPDVSEAERRETMVEIAVADYLGRFKDGTALEAGSIQAAVRAAALAAAPKSAARRALQSLAGMLALVRRYLGVMFRVAAGIRQARESGALKPGEAWDVIMDKLLGTDQQAAHDKAVLAEVEAMGNSFSMSNAPGAAQQQDSTPPGGPTEAELTARSWRAVKPGDDVSGLEVGEGIPNRGSISASLGDDYEIIGLREVPFSAYGPEIGEADLAVLERTARPLADEILESGVITPLIFVVDNDTRNGGIGYVLEGAHRIDSLDLLRKPTFPALVVLDTAALQKQSPAPASGADTRAAVVEQGETFSLAGVTPQQDAEYMAAVERGDMETAQRMVDEAARAAGYNVGPVFHGTAEQITVFDPSKKGATSFVGQGLHFFSGRSDTAETYSNLGSGAFRQALNAVSSIEAQIIEQAYSLGIQTHQTIAKIVDIAQNSRRVSSEDANRLESMFADYIKASDNLKRIGWDPGTPTVLRLFLSISNPYTADASGLNWSAVIPEAVDAINTGAFNGAIIENVNDRADDEAALADTTYIVARANAIKSADPVTRDEAGNVIPLSQRFNPERDEITFSLASARTLEEAAARMDAVPKKPEQRLQAMQKGAENLRGIQRVWLFNDGQEEPFYTTQAAVERQRRAMRKSREAELLQQVEDDFGDMEEVKTLASPTNSPLLAELFTQSPGDAFPRSRIARKPADYEGGEYDGAAELPAWLFGGNSKPDNLAQELYEAGLIREPSPDALWQGIEQALKTSQTMKDRLAKYRQRRAEAKQQAREESQEWADAQNTGKALSQEQRQEVTRSLVALDAILMSAPPEIRGKVGGFVKLSKLTTDKARTRFLIGRVEKMLGIWEKWLRKEYNTRLDSLIERALSKTNVAGEKAMSKVGADAAHLLQAMDAARELDDIGVTARIAELQERIDSGELTAEQEALASREQQLVQLAGDWKNADAAQRAAAYEAARDIFDGGYLEWSKKVVAKRERREAARESLGTDTGKAGTKTERAAAAKKELGWSGKMKNWMLDLSSFQEAARYVFGDNSTEAKTIIDREREASNAREDEVQQAHESVEELFAGMAGSRYAGTQLQFRMSQPSIDTEKDGRISELQGITATLIWQQEDGKRHMEAFGYTQANMDAIEAALTPEGRRVRQWLREQYAAEYAPLNALYRERFGVNLPTHDNYAPITVKPKVQKSGDMVDPVTGVAVASGGILTPGSLRTRSRRATAEPDFKDALQVYLGRVRQLSHWKAYYDLATDMQSILADRDLGNKIEARAGAEGLQLLRAWKDYFSQGGTRDAASFMSISRDINNAVGRAAQMILFGRVGTLLIQATQLGASLAEMPVGSYVKRFGMLFAGRLGWADAIRSPFIQRRLKQAPPIVRQAMDALAAAKPNRVKQAAQEVGKLIAGADALFTAGTYAILLDYHRTQGKAAGLTGEELETYAAGEAERSTERVAQPTRPGARSLYENTQTNGMARAMWAFASEARQKIALAAWAVANWKKDPARAARVMTVTWLVGGVAASMIRSAWRDARDDEDDELFDSKNWDLRRMAMQSALGPLQGIPFLGDVLEGAANRAFGIYQPGGDLFAGIAEGAGAARKIATGKADDAEEIAKAAKSILFSMGFFNDTLAGAAALSNIAEDAAKLLENLDGPEGSK